MAANQPNKLNIIALVLLAAMMLAFVLLGRWQLSRADERHAISAAIEHGRAGPPVMLSTQTPADQLQAWRPAQVQGVWHPEYSLLLDNRNLDGRPGLWLATPLVLTDGSAVLVLRGWFARPLGQEQAPVIQTPEGMQQISGELSLRVPRLFELWGTRSEQEQDLPDGWPINGAHAGQLEKLDKLIRLQNVDLSQLRLKTGLKLLPVVLLQKNDVDDGLKRIWPEPSVDADKNVGYAMQWFGFAGIALAIWLGLAWRIWRPKRPKPAQ
jgi:cytochrome oxidase assembly protein ShyY1